MRAFPLDMGFDGFGWLHGSCWQLCGILVVEQYTQYTISLFYWLYPGISIRVQTGGGCSLAHNTTKDTPRCAGTHSDCCQVQPEPGDAMWPVPHRTTKAQGADPSPCLPKIPGYCPRRSKDRQSIFCIPWLAVKRVWVLRFEGTLCVAEIQTKNMNPTRYVQESPPHTQMCIYNHNNI